MAPPKGARLVCVIMYGHTQDDCCKELITAYLLYCYFFYHSATELLDFLKRQEQYIFTDFKVCG